MNTELGRAKNIVCVGSFDIPKIVDEKYTLENAHHSNIYYEKNTEELWAKLPTTTTATSKRNIIPVNNTPPPHTKTQRERDTVSRCQILRHIYP